LGVLVLNKTDKVQVTNEHLGASDEGKEFNKFVEERGRVTMIQGSVNVCDGKGEL